MANKLRKKLFLMSLVLFILVMSVSVTVVNAAGPPDYTKARLRYNGTYTEIHNSTADAPWECYQIYSVAGSTLNITVIFNYPTFEIDLQIENSTKNGITTAQSYGASGSENCTFLVNTTQYFYALCYGIPSNVMNTFTLIISGSIDPPPTPPIPGFETIFLMLGIIMAIGVIFWLRIDKKIISNTI